MAGNHERGLPRKKKSNCFPFRFFFLDTPLSCLPAIWEFLAPDWVDGQVRQSPRAHCPWAAGVKSVCAQPLPRKKNQCKNKKSRVCVSGGVWVHKKCFRKLMKTPWCNQIASRLPVSGSGNCPGHPILPSRAWGHCLNAQMRMRWRNK